MTCDRARQIDLDLYLVEPGAAEWEAFRRHFPTCPNCAAALEAASELESGLQGVLDGSHPAAHTLLAYAAATGSLPEASAVEIAPLDDAQRAVVARHAADCLACRDTLAALVDFDARFAAAAQPAASPATGVDEPSGPAWIEALRGVLRPLFMPSEAGWTPGPALALVATILLVAIGWAGWRLTGAGSTAPAPVAVVEERALEVPVPTPPEPRAPPRDTQPEAPPAELAGTAPETKPTELDVRPVEPKPPESEPSGSSQLAVASPAPETVSDVPPTPGQADERSAEDRIVAEPSPPRPGPGPDAAPTHDAPSDLVDGEWLLAMAEGGPPEYAMPADALARVRISETYRSVGDAVPTLVALAPAGHAGRSSTPTPAVYWLQSAADPERRLRFTLLDANDMPLVERVIEADGDGVQGIELASLGVTLEPRETYGWLVELVDAPDAPSALALAGATLQTTDFAPADRATAQALAERGLWYDALTAVSRAIEQSDDPRLRLLRAELLEGVGLDEAAAFDRQAADVGSDSAGR